MTVESLVGVELVMTTTTSCEPPPVSVVGGLLQRSDIPARYAVPIPTSTAFRRAADSIRNKDTLVRVYTEKHTGTLCCQVDLQLQSGGVLDQRLVGTYKLTPDGIRCVNCTDMAGSHSSGWFEFKYADYLNNYSWGDISKMIRDILIKDGLGVYSPRKSGGIYFVPDTDTLLDKLSEFSDAVGIRLLRYTVPDTAAQRAEVSEAISAGIASEVQAHSDAVDAYKGIGGIGTSRLDALQSTLSLVRKLGHLMVDGGDSHIDRLIEVMNRVAELPTRTVPSTRRIVAMPSSLI